MRPVHETQVVTTGDLIPLGKHESRGTVYVPLDSPLIPWHDQYGNLIGWEQAPSDTWVVDQLREDLRGAQNFVVFPSPEPVRRESTLEQGVKRWATYAGLTVLALAAFCLFMFALVIVAGLIGGA